MTYNSPPNILWNHAIISMCPCKAWKNQCALPEATYLKVRPVHGHVHSVVIWPPLEVLGMVRVANSVGQVMVNLCKAETGKKQHLNLEFHLSPPSCMLKRWRSFWDWWKCCAPTQGHGQFCQQDWSNSPPKPKSQVTFSHVLARIQLFQWQHLSHSLNFFINIVSPPFFKGGSEHRFHEEWHEMNMKLFKVISPYDWTTDDKELELKVFGHCPV